MNNLLVESARKLYAVAFHTPISAVGSYNWMDVTASAKLLRASLNILDGSAVGSSSMHHQMRVLLELRFRGQRMDP